MGKHFFLLIVFLSSMGCTSNLTHRMQNFMGKRISFDVSLDYIPDTFDTRLRIKSDSTIKFVVFYDSTECSSCRISHLRQFDEIYDLTDRYGIRVFPVIIFSPASDQIADLKRELLLQKISYPIYIDTNCDFEKANPCMPKDRRMHTFLLTRDNKVILIGNPINNPALWDLYVKTIKEL